MADNGKKLSHTLIDLGFFCAFGTTERPGLHPEGFLVKKGTPCTWDSNNGVVCVYDEDGRPWVTLNRKIQDISMDFAVLQRTYNIRRGAPVPHSNDGGQFMLYILPTLMVS